MSKQYDKNMISATNDNENLLWYEVNDKDFDLYGDDRRKMIFSLAESRKNLQNP